ncbi:MAG: TonB-dependent hemoglobin/transferrin/lactoferrin family receptor [Proteobacteria bacterium]|nr:TonB-dependent hemoglobin/transferrin/lactoferrin family receptor [Pseudomonadota bacterium]
MNIIKKLIFTTILSSCLMSTSNVNAEEEILELDKVTVTANRTTKTIEELSNKVSVITAEEIEKYSFRNIRDLVRYEPGVTVSGSGRFGLSGFNIRGIGGDRILTLIDGAPIADEFSFGPNLSSRRNFVDIDSLKAVEIIRGPASSLYGSNAIGGLVTFVTKDPNDFTKIDEKDYLSARFGYDTVDSSFDKTLTYATANDSWGAMVIATHRDGSEYKTFYNDDSTGANRRSADPIENTDINILGKLVFTPNDRHKFKITVEGFKSDTQTNALSQAGTVFFGTLKQAVTADDSRKRNRLSLEYNGIIENSIFDEINFNFYNQDSESEQLTFENLLTATQVNQARTRQSFYAQDNVGFRLNFIKDIDSAVSQQWVYGLDYDTTDVKTLRLGETINIDTGEQIPEYSNFPTRDFPNSKYTSYGIFVQNEMTFLDEKLLITPSLRYDNFELTPQVDDIYLSGNTGTPTPSPYKESELSSKLGGLYYFNQNWSLFGQYAEGFKAPPIDAVNTGFTNIAGGYTTLPNPDLNSESSSTVELGLRFKGSFHQFEVSIYQSQYDDFIQSLAFRGLNPDTGLLEFQARNLDKTKISGIELRGTWNMSKIFDGLRLQYAYAQSDGKDKTTGLPINSIQPQSFVAGVAYDSANGRWGTELIMTLNARKTDIDDSALQPGDSQDPDVQAFNAPGSGIFDLIGYYQFTDDIKLNYGLFNLSNKKYWNWNDVLLQPESSPRLPRATQPGRNASITFKIEF